MQLYGASYTAELQLHVVILTMESQLLGVPVNTAKMKLHGIS